MPDVAAQIESDPNLVAIKNKLVAELGSVSNNGLPQMNILLVIALIGLAIQIFMACRDKNGRDVVRSDIKNVNKVSWLKLWRFRRALKAAARKDPQFNDVDIDKAYSAMFNVAEQLNDEQIDALLADR
jgi:hypothetical protein